MSKTKDVCALARQWAEDPAHGYDQGSRDGPDYDCSSLLNHLWESIGVHVMAAGATYTGNMRAAYLRCGFEIAPVDADDLSVGAGLIAGDVLLNEERHTALYVGGGRIVHASINELGTTTGGATGDQTGTEICERGYFNFPWDVVLRFAADVPEDGPRTCVVQPGDSWWAIAARELGDGSQWERLMRLNGYTSPDDPIYAGQVFKLQPDSGSTESQPGVSNPTTSPGKTELQLFLERAVSDLGGKIIW